MVGQSALCKAVDDKRWAEADTWRAGLLFKQTWAGLRNGLSGS